MLLSLIGKFMSKNWKISGRVMITVEAKKAKSSNSRVLRSIIKNIYCFLIEHKDWIFYAIMHGCFFHSQSVVEYINQIT